ncbi:MAG: DUF4340 domain-containing protein [Spirochaetes bacterium]|nr:DUF4340 domain-containing protein [Spirochaetota bacterium]
MKNIFLKFKDRKFIIYYLCVLLVFQTSVFILLKVFSFQSTKTRSIGQNLIKGFNKDKVISLIFSDSKNTFSLEKEGGLWFVNINDKIIPGDNGKIDFYLEILKELSSGIIRDSSEGSETFKKYGLSEENMRKLKIVSDKKKDFILYIGNTGKKKGTSYIRLENEKMIREVNSLISAETNIIPVQWLERRVFPETINTEDVQTCEIRSNFDWFNESYTIKYNPQKDGGIFILDPDPGKKFKPDILQNLLKNIFELKIDDYKLDVDITDRERSASITINLKNGKSNRLYFFKSGPDDGRYIIDTDFNDYLYIVDNIKIKKILLPVKELIALEID